ncbi:hypothetical protein TanjilG_17194 [Lupinus angustifolius]|uniref:Uncharacterized protein n=1 Tax=Lupinus angustifolius TaxID=3871 RepID=A0A4P1R0T9_LUPAN|nr:PREDICTED: uncharacterized protein LOC109325744 [Lupinus angustifolius]OIV99384.1 hypothetical protein TanjilG_17194 [Lupinus angustifolius]
MSFTVLGIALTFVFGCILLGLIVGLGYLLWWKKTRTCIGIKIGQENNVKGLLCGTCWKTQSTINPRSVNVATNKENISSSVEPDLELGVKDSNDMLLKTLEEGVDSELMRLHNLAGPPRFLFTIKEETIEDLESEDRSRKGSSTRSFNDIMVAINSTPFLFPVACSPSRCSLDNIDSYKHHGVNPPFESSLESDFNNFRTLPPSKFKFLRDADEKLNTRLVEDAQRKAQKNLDTVPETEIKDSSNAIRVTEERDKSLLRFMNKNNKEKEHRELQHLPKLPSSTAQVLPLASSFTTTFEI